MTPLDHQPINIASPTKNRIKKFSKDIIRYRHQILFCRIKTKFVNIFLLNLHGHKYFPYCQIDVKQMSDRCQTDVKKVDIIAVSDLFLMHVIWDGVI